MPFSPLHPPPEDQAFLNKSLLDQLDAQADAEPTDSATSDDSSHGSPHVPFHQPIHSIPLDNDFNKMNQFYPRASFTAFPNATRAPARSHYREPPSATAPQFYPASQDPFPPQLTSPVLAPYDPRASFDFKAAYPPLDYNQQQQQHPQQQQQQQQQGQQKLNGYAAPYVNGGMHSQTPYGPHVPMGAMSAAGLPPPAMMGPMGAMQEDISTIFVVGFPEDMQEREFQNMFTFSPGFEAATLKIPNKEYTAYGGVLPPPSSNSNSQSTTNPSNAQQQAQRGGLGGGGTYNAYAGSNDPYNLVTVNQGGVVVDAVGRDGLTSWPAPPPSSGASDDLNQPSSQQSAQQQQQSQPGAYNPNPNAGMGIGIGGVLPPRKQIIGFAKFRTREEALGARDVLQGRRVDIDKGAVLKAEMAKKNLHTKRGVGPVGGGGVGPVGGVNGGGMGMNGVGGGGMMNGVGVGVGGGLNGMGMNGGMLSEMYGGDPLSPREREAGALVAMGLPPPPGPPLSSNNNNPNANAPNPLNNNNHNNPLSPTLAHVGANLNNMHVNGGHGQVNGVGVRAWLGEEEEAQAMHEHDLREREREREKERERRQTSVLSAMGLPTGPGRGSVSVGAAARGARERLEEARASGEEGERMRRTERERRAGAFEAFAALRDDNNNNNVGGGGPWDAPPGPRLAMGGQRRSPSPDGNGFGGGAMVNGMGTPFAGEAPRAFSSPPPMHHLQQQQHHGEFHPHQHQQQHNPHQHPHFGYGGYGVGGYGMQQEQQQQQQQYQMQLEQHHQQQHQQHPQAYQHPHPHPHPHSHLAHRTERSESSASEGSAEELERGVARLAVRNASVASLSNPSPAHTNITSAPGPGPGTHSAPGANTPISIPVGGASGSASASASGGSASGGSGGGSPQLASPASSSAGGGAGRAVDQNPPINTLYVGNLPALPSAAGNGVGGGGGAGGGPTMEYLEAALRELFGVCAGFRQMSFRPKANGPMCFVEFEDVSFATKTLNELYGNTLGGLIKGGGIRLSYSKNPLGVRTPTSASGGGATLQQQQGQSMAAAEAAFHPRLTSPPPPPADAVYGAPVAAYPAPRFFGAAPEGAWGRRWETEHRTVPRTVTGAGVNGAFSPFAHSPAPSEPQQQQQQAPEGEAQ